MNVLDASVIIKWFIVEEDSDKATYLRKEYMKNLTQIAVPDLMLYELTNALRFNKNITSDKIIMALQAILI